VATVINSQFEAVWESVRPVPIVRIDFGNGTLLTRTLHGNIATYVCAADGQVLDILAGIYTPAVYMAQLQQFRLLANYAEQEGKEKRGLRLREYHQGQADALAKNEPAAVLVNQAFMSKRAIEGGIKAVLVPGTMVKHVRPSLVSNKKPTDERLEPAEDLANWKLLAEDTRINESVRREQIHSLLASKGAVQPERIVKWLYKDVLHADLDDPYLGLGSTLFANYPFKDQ